MTQTGADRIVVGLGAVIGSAVGWFVGGNAGAYWHEREHGGYEGGGSTEAVVLSQIGTVVGAAIGAMLATPPAEKDLPPRTGVSGVFHNPEFP